MINILYILIFSSWTYSSTFDPAQKFTVFTFKIRHPGVNSTSLSQSKAMSSLATGLRLLSRLEYRACMFQAEPCLRTDLHQAQQLDYAEFRRFKVTNRPKLVCFCRLLSIGYFLARNNHLRSKNLF